MQTMIPTNRIVFLLASALAAVLVTWSCSTLSSVPEDVDLEVWYRAVAGGDLETVQAGLAAGMPANRPRADGRTPLQVAVGQGRFRVAKALLDAGAKVDKAAKDTLPPLYYAVYQDAPGGVELLMEAGAHLKRAKGAHRDPLDLALVRQDPGVIAALAAADGGARQRVDNWLADQAGRTEDGQLDVAALNGEHLCIQGLLELAAAEDHQTAIPAAGLLHRAADEGSLTADYALTRAYADPEGPLFLFGKADNRISNAYLSPSSRERTFYTRRATRDYDPLAAYIYGEMLMRSNSNPDEARVRGRAQIRWSAEAGSPFAMAELGWDYADHFPEASPEEIARQMVTWMQRASDQGHAQAANLLADCYLSGQGVGRDLERALVLYGRAGELGRCDVYHEVAQGFERGEEGFPEDKVKALAWYEKGAACGYPYAHKRLGEAREKGELGLTIDHFEAMKHYYLAREDWDGKVAELTSKGLPAAVAGGDAAAVERWLPFYDPDLPGFLDGWLKAAEVGAVDLARRFVEAGIDPKVRHRNQTALTTAALYGNTEMVTWLLDQGCGVEAGGPLAIAAGQGHQAVVSLLLDKGAAVDGESGTGSPRPLQRAIARGHHSVAVSLLQKGAASIDFTRADGKRLMADLRAKGDTAMLRLLLEAEGSGLSPEAKKRLLDTIAGDEHAAERKQKWLAGELLVRRDGRGAPLADQAASHEDNPWQCVSDEMSGLTWLVKDDAGGLHDKDQVFYFPDGSESDCRQENCDALAYREMANRSKLCGAVDWRLPTIEEVDALCYPQVAAAFPHWPGFLLWSRIEPEGKIVLLNASGLLGRHKAVIAFGNTGQTLLVRGEVQLLPEPSQQDFTIIAMD